jgi:hypothetical protein
VQCELSGRGRELEDHDQHLNQLTRDCAIWHVLNLWLLCDVRYLEDVTSGIGS